MTISAEMLGMRNGEPTLLGTITLDGKGYAVLPPALAWIKDVKVGRSSDIKTPADGADYIRALPLTFRPPGVYPIIRGDEGQGRDTTARMAP